MSEYSASTHSAGKKDLLSPPTNTNGIFVDVADGPQSGPPPEVRGVLAGSATRMSRTTSAPST